MLSAEAMYKNSRLEIFKPLALGLCLTNTKNISKKSIDKYADIESPCGAPFI